MNSREHYREGPMVTVQLYDVTKDVFELKADAGQGLATAVQVVHTDDRLVKDDLTVACGHRHFFDDASLARHAECVEVSQAGACDVNVANGKKINVA